MKYFSTYMYTKHYFAYAEISKGLFYMVIWNHITWPEREILGL